MNVTVFEGKINSEVEVKTTQYATPYVGFKLEVENYNSSGELRLSHPYITVTGQGAIKCANELRKGNDVIIFCEYADGKYGGYFKANELKKIVSNKKNNIKII